MSAVNESIDILGDRYYTVAGAMKALNVGRQTIDTEVREGRLEVFHHPKGNLFSMSACLN